MRRIRGQTVLLPLLPAHLCHLWHLWHLYQVASLRANRSPERPRLCGLPSSVLLGGYSPLALVLGALTSFVVGLISLRWLLRIITQRGLDGFVYYVLTASTLTFIWQGYEYFYFAK